MVIFLFVFIDKYYREPSFWFIETGVSQIWRAILALLKSFYKCLASVVGRMDGFSVLSWMRLTHSNLVFYRLSVHFVSKFFLTLGGVDFARLPEGRRHFV